MRVVIIDAGHGTINPHTGGIVTPGKRAEYGDLEPILLAQGHKESTYVEGVFNRRFAYILAGELIDRGIMVLPVFHAWQDFALSARKNFADACFKYHKNSVFISIHSNAAENRLASGFEAYRHKSAANGSPAFYLNKCIVQKLIGAGKKVRADDTAGKQADFYLLRNLPYPASLLEVGFHTNKEEVTNLLCDNKAQQEYAGLIAEGILEYFNLNSA